MKRKKNKAGRPRLDEADRMVVLPIRVTPELKAKFYEMGSGAERFFHVSPKSSVMYK